MAATATTSADLSPKSMAEAAYTAAVKSMAQIERKEGGREVVAEPNPAAPANDGGGVVVDGARRNDAENEADVGARIEQLWQKGGNPEANFGETLQILLGEVEALTNEGIGAFRELDATKRQLAQAKELAATKERETERLKAIDEQSRASLSNLLRAVETSKADARDGSRSAQMEARLRSEVQTLRDERDKAHTELSDHRRKRSLLEEELRLTKSKLSRVMQEKISMERDSRAAISLARSLDQNNNNDTSYYKRKVGELTEKVQSQKQLLSKQGNQIAELSGGQSQRSRKSYDLANDGGMVQKETNA